MSADIKTVLTKEQIEQMFLKVMGCDGGWALYEVTPGNMIQLGRAIERAVLEAAPASSAMAQAVDAVTVPRELFDELIDMAQDEASAYHLSHKGYKPEQHAQRDKVIAAARSILESQQSPVQASDAGSQG